MKGLLFSILSLNFTASLAVFSPTIVSFISKFFLENQDNDASSQKHLGCQASICNITVFYNNYLRIIKLNSVLLLF